MNGVKTYLDGDKWCAIYEPTFTNIQDSPVGFGNPEFEALSNLVNDQVKHIQSDALLMDMPEGTYIAKGKQYRAWYEDEDGNFRGGLDAYDASTPEQALKKLREKMQSVGLLLPPQLKEERTEG